MQVAKGTAPRPTHALQWRTELARPPWCLLVHREARTICKSLLGAPVASCAVGARRGCRARRPIRPHPCISLLSLQQPMAPRAIRPGPCCMSHEVTQPPRQASAHQRASGAVLRSAQPTHMHGYFSCIEEHRAWPRLHSRQFHDVQPLGAAVDQPPAASMQRGACLPPALLQQRPTARRERAGLRAGHHGPAAP